jgi:dTDP-L-rhamnose 4-epimerase
VVGHRLALVTGGAGFIGSHVVDELAERGWAVRVIDSLHPHAHRETPGYLREGVDYRWADLRDSDAVRSALAGVEAVSHQAAMVGLGSDLGDIADYVGHNSLGTAVLLRAMHELGHRGPLVLGSSMVVYGEGGYECRAHGPQAPPPRPLEQLAAGRFEPVCELCGATLVPVPVSETAPSDPRNVYAASKLNQEHLCAAFARERGNRVARLRYHNVYGPRMPRDTPYSGVAAIFRSALAGGRAPTVFEDGRQLRDFVHVRDVARANRLALEAAADGAYNVASGEPRSVGEMASEIARAMDGPEPAVTGEFRGGDVRHVFASIDRARRELGYRPRVSFGAGVAEFARAPLRAGGVDDGAARRPSAGARL